MTRAIASEPSIPPVKGTADWLPADHARLAGLEAVMLRGFDLAGYDRINTPVLEPVELHERKSGAGFCLTPVGQIRSRSEPGPT